MQKDNVIKPGEVLYIQTSDDKIHRVGVRQAEGHKLWTKDFEGETLLVGQNVLVSYCADNGIYSFTAQVGQRQEKLSVIIRTSDFNRMQRREHYRLSHMFDLFIREQVITEDQDKDQKNVEENEEKEFISCQGFDISETGIGGNSPRPWAPGTQIDCGFEINGMYYCFDAVIARNNMKVIGNSFVYNIGIRFCDTSEREIRALRQFIFRKQMSTRK